MKNKRTYERLGNILNNSLKSMGMDARIKENQVFVNWEDIVGKQISAVTNPSYIKFKVLFVHVSNHIWMQQLAFWEETIIAKINDYIGRTVVNKIYFRLGHIDK